MNTTTQILQDKLELINWISTLNDNRVLDKLRFLMENYKPKKVVAVQTEDVQTEELQTENAEFQVEASKKVSSEPAITNADDEAFDEEMKDRFPHLFK